MSPTVTPASPLRFARHVAGYVAADATHRYHVYNDWGYSTRDRKSKILATVEVRDLRAAVGNGHWLTAPVTHRATLDSQRGCRAVVQAYRDLGEAFPGGDDARWALAVSRVVGP